MSNVSNRVIRDECQFVNPLKVYSSISKIQNKDLNGIYNDSCIKRRFLKGSGVIIFGKFCLCQCTLNLAGLQFE